LIFTACLFFVQRFARFYDTGGKTTGDIVEMSTDIFHASELLMSAGQVCLDKTGGAL